MSIEVTWFGHNCWMIDADGRRILLDPFLDDSPTAPVKSHQVDPEFIIVSHGHFDHISDLVKIATRTGATAIANYEICEWAARQGVKNTEPMNLGGGIQFAAGHVQLTLAHHSSTFPDGSAAGSAAGVLLTLSGKRLYFACDTALFLDMKLIGAVGLDFAVVPIGDRYTMGPADSIEAIKLLSPNRVAPAHYNTWPPIAQDVRQWAERVRTHTKAEPIVLEPGGKFVV